MARERRKISDAPAEGVRTVPSHDDIARRAHEIWLGRGSEPGRELDHWLAAEQELIAEKPRRRRVDSREPTAAI